jgi:metal-responsive CopG/Arc/MetJ family transcriptional regulator
MRTLIDIPEPQIRALDSLSRRRGVSRASVVRAAVAEYLAKERPVAGSDDEAFGLWRDRTESGADYQSRLRSEW